MAFATRSSFQLTAIALALASIGAPAAPINWATDASGNWSVPTNWSPTGLPDTNSDVTIVLTGLKTITHDTGNDTINTLAFNAASTNPNATLLINNGSSLSVRSGGTNGSVIRADNGTVNFYGGTLSNNGTLDTINGGSIVFNNATLAGGTITGDAGSAVTFVNSAFINGQTGAGNNGPITNNGRIVIGSGQTVYAAGTIAGSGTVTQQNNSDLRIASGAALTLSGAGPYVMTAGDSRIFSNDGAGTLVNAAGHTIQGLGQIGVNNTGIQNAGVITANVNGQTLTIDPRDGEGNMVNTGTLRAENGGTLQLFAGNYNNQTGSIRALDGSSVLINNSAIEGGLLTTVGSGANTFVNSAFLDGTTHGAITNTGNLIIGSGQNVYAQGSLVDNHGITQQNNSDFRIATGASLTLSGSGALSMTAGDSRIFSNDGLGTLTNSAGYVIQGLGQIGVNNTAIQNAGVITANLSGQTLTIDPRDGEGNMVNTGTLRAENGGTLQLFAGNYNNQTGSIRALDGSSVLINNSAIEGGLLTTVGSGTNTFVNSAFLDGTTHGAITNTGNLIIGSGQNVYAQGSLVDNHGITQQNNSDFRIASGSNLTLSGTGSLSMTAGDSRIFSNDGGGTLTNSAGYVIQGLGQIGVNNTAIQNAGVITANVNGQTLTIDPRDGEGNMVNTGTLRAENGGTLQLFAGNYNNQAGSIRALDGSSVLINNSAIEGGLLTTVGSGTNTFVNSALLDGTTHGAITNTGNLIIGSGQNVYAQGSLVDNHGITQQNNSDFRIATGASLTLSGSGALSMTAGDSRIFSNDGLGTLTNSAGYTIQGLGQVGLNQTKIVNAGVVTANVANQTLTIDPIDGEGNFINTGTLRAENGGTLQFFAGNYNNAGGAIVALNNSTVLVNSAAVEGGTMTTSGSGTITFVNNAFLDGTTNGALTNNGAVVFGTGSNIYATGTVVDNGTVAQQNNTDLRITAGTTLTLSGTGVYTMAAGDSRLFSNDGTGALTNGAGHTIQGVGQIGLNQTAVTNAGTIVANVSGQTLTLSSTGATVNQSTGVLAANNGGTLYVDKAVTGTGTIRTDSGGTVILNQGAQTGQLINNANLSIATNNVTVSSDYSNANFGTGNGFNKRANISGTGQILASGNTAQAITGANITNGASAAPTLTIGNVRVGGTTYNYQVANTGTSGPSIRGAIETAVNGGNITDSRLSGSGVTAGNYGPVATGAASGNLGVTFTVASAGALAPLSGQAVHVANNFDNVSEQTLNIALASGAAAYNAAIGSATPSPVTFGNVRVGANDTQALTVRNTQTASSFSEDLNAAFGASTGSASGSGSITHLVAGGTNNSSLSASLSTATAGAKSGSVTINYDTSGTVNGVSNGLGTMSVGSQTIALSGNVYNTAVGSTSPSPVTVANQRVGGTATSALTVANTAAAGNFSEALNASISSTSGNATGGGSVGNIAAGASNSGALNVGVNTAAAGARTGNVTIAYQSDGTGSNGNSGLAAIAAGSQTIAVSGNVYQTASGAILTAPLNFGTVQVGQTVSQNLAIQNTATGPAGFVEDLNASFGASSGTGASRITGSGSVAGLAAGGTSNGLTVGVNTSSAGTVNGSIAVNFFSAGSVGGVSNGLGSLAVGSAGYGVTGTIQGTANVVDQASPVVNNAPIALGNVRIGSTSPSAFVSVTNQATGNQQAALNASISGNAPVTASGSFNLLGPGATNASSLAVGFDTSTAGSKNGNATIAFVSDASNVGNCAPNCQVALPSQNVAVTGAVYRLANPAATPSTVTVAGRVGSASPVTAINVTNISPDIYTEGLTVSRGATSAGFTSSGSITNLVAGGNSNAIGVTLNTATAGTFAGTQALSYVSTGAGTDGAADLAIGSGSVTLNGKVYTPAAAALNTPSVAFGIVHVGDVVAAQSVSVTNSAPTTALNDALLASAAGATGPFTASGDLGAGLASQQTSNALKVGLNTATAGVYSGSAAFSAASHDADLSDVALANLAVGLTGQVNNYAADAFVFGSGAGSLTRSGSTFVLDYGTVAQGSGTRNTTLVADNAAAGPADLLDGMFQFLDPADFGESGFTSFANLAAGQNTGALMLSFNAMTVGDFTDTITLHGVGHNASGYSAAIGDIQLIVRGSVTGQVTPPPAGVPEPDSLLLLGLGIPLLFVRRGRRARRPIAQ